MDVRPTPYGTLVALHASLATLRPSLTWQPRHWLVATVKLHQQLADALRALRTLRASPALDLAEQQPTPWLLAVDAAIEQLPSGNHLTLASTGRSPRSGGRPPAPWPWWWCTPMMQQPRPRGRRLWSLAAWSAGIGLAWLLLGHQDAGLPAVHLDLTAALSGAPPCTNSRPRLASRRPPRTGSVNGDLTAVAALTDRITTSLNSILTGGGAGGRVRPQPDVRSQRSCPDLTESAPIRWRVS
jgi:hypothetical protein